MSSLFTIFALSSRSGPTSSRPSKIRRVRPQNSSTNEKTGLDGLIAKLSQTLPRTTLISSTPEPPIRHSDDLAGMGMGLEQGLGLVFSNTSCTSLLLPTDLCPELDRDTLTNTHVFKRMYEILDDECFKTEGELDSLDSKAATTEGPLSEEDEKCRSSLMEKGTRLVEFGNLLDAAQTRLCRSGNGAMEKAYTGRFRMAKETIKALESGSMAREYPQSSYLLTSGREGMRWDPLAMTGIVSGEASDDLTRLKGQAGKGRN